MRHFISTGVTWLALCALTFSAPLPLARYDSTFSSLQRPQIDITQKRREAQLLVPNISPSSSQWRDFSTQITQGPRNSWTPSEAHLPKDAHTRFLISDPFVPTISQSIDHTTSQLNYNNGLPIPSHGVDQLSSSSFKFTPINNINTKRQETAPPAPAKPTITDADEDRKTQEGQKKAEGDGIQASTPPAATVMEENKKTGEIHGGCNEVDLAKPISRRIRRRDERGGRVQTGVRWACLG